MLKYMANASFYRLKFRTIDWLTNYLVGGWLQTLLAGQNVISNIRIGAHSLHESCGKLSQLFKKKKNELI